MSIMRNRFELYSYDMSEFNVNMVVDEVFPSRRCLGFNPADEVERHSLTPNLIAWLRRSVHNEKD